MLVLLVPYHVCLGLVSQPTTFECAGEDLRGPVPCYVSRVALHRHKVLLAPGAAMIGKEGTVMTETVAGECCNSVLLMPTKVAAHFANRLFPLPEKLAATTFGMCCSSDTSLKQLLTLGADEEPPS